MQFLHMLVDRTRQGRLDMAGSHQQRTDLEYKALHERQTQGKYIIPLYFYAREREREGEREREREGEGETGRQTEEKDERSMCKNE